MSLTSRASAAGNSTEPLRPSRHVPGWHGNCYMPPAKWTLLEGWKQWALKAMATSSPALARGGPRTAVIVLGRIRSRCWLPFPGPLPGLLRQARPQLGGGALRASTSSSKKSELSSSFGNNRVVGTAGWQGTSLQGVWPSAGGLPHPCGPSPAWSKLNTQDSSDLEPRQNGGPMPHPLRGSPWAAAGCPLPRAPAPGPPHDTLLQGQTLAGGPWCE